MSRTVVGVLRGGTSNEYDLSLKTGNAILNALDEERYNTRDIFIDKRGVWHLRGIPSDPMRALSQVDVVVSGLHGGVGEDGTVARLLERAGVPYAGSRPMPSALSLNKIRARHEFERAGILIPYGFAFSLSDDMDTGEMARQVFASFGPPYIVKPANEGASYGIQLALTIVALPDVLADVLDAFGTAVVEEYVMGDEATVGIVEDFRNEDLYAFPPARVEYPEGSRHIEIHHHLGGHIQHHVPSDFSHREKKALMDAARRAHRALGLSHVSRSDFILTKRGPYLLEVNAQPGLYEGAAMPPMLESIGSSVPDFLEHVIGLARK